MSVVSLSFNQAGARLALHLHLMLFMVRGELTLLAIVSNNFLSCNTVVTNTVCVCIRLRSLVIDSA